MSEEGRKQWERRLGKCKLRKYLIEQICPAAQIDPMENKKVETELKAICDRLSVWVGFRLSYEDQAKSKCETKTSSS